MQEGPPQSYSIWRKYRKQLNAFEGVTRRDISGPCVDTPAGLASTSSFCGCNIQLGILYIQKEGLATHIWILSDSVTVSHCLSFPCCSSIQTEARVKFFSPQSLFVPIRSVAVVYLSRKAMISRDLILYDLFVVWRTITSNWL